MTRICIVDGNSYIHRAFHAVRELRTSRGIPTNAVYGFLVMLRKVLEDEKPDLAAVVFDAGGATFRHRLYPAYKATRVRMPDDLAVQLDYIHRLTAAFGVTAIAREGVEADDIIASLGKAAREAGMEIVYVTGDKDILQLVDGRAACLDTMKEKRVTLESFRAERGFDPPRMVDLMALTGDSSDNVPGVPGIGPKTAEKLLADFGSLDGIYRNLDRMPEGKVKRILAEHRAEAELSRRLVTLRDDFDLGVDVRQLTIGDPDRETQRRLYEELEMKKFLRELGAPPVPAASAADPGPAIRPAADPGRWLAGLPPGAPLSLACSSDGGRILVAMTADGREGVVLDAADPRLSKAAARPAWAYDSKTCRHALEGTPLAGIAWSRDILLAAYLLDPSEKGTGLADLETAWLGASWLSTPVEEPSQGALFVEEAARGEALLREAGVVLRLGDSLWERLGESGMTHLHDDLELPLAAVLYDMERVGIAVDAGALREMSKEIGTILDDLVARIHAAAGTEFNVASPKQLADVLFTRLGLPVLRKTKTGPSTDEEVLTALAPMHEVPSLLLAHRQLAKLRNTYVDVLPGLVGADGRIHTTFNQAVTATGRLSSSNPNLQNIPVRTEWGNRIRRAFVPTPGWTFVSADYSQIELRILAHLSGDPVLREAFRNGEDIHARTAMALFGVESGLVGKEMRRAAKTVNFGIIYGMSPFGLSRQLGIDQARAKAYIDSYFETYRGVRTYLGELVAAAKRDGYVATLLGRRRQLRELQSDKPQVVQFAERAALNTPIQGTAADLIKKAMIDLSRRLAAEKFEARLLVQIHDELLLEAPPEEVERVSALLRECMEGAVAFDVPILVDLATGPSWADLH